MGKILLTGISQKTALSVVSVILLCLAPAGCSLGPGAMKGNRLDYNVSVQRSNNEELLLNIVRSRYAEPPFFLQVGAISSSFSYSANLGVSGTVYERGGAAYSNTLAPNLGAGIAENPTITYVPIQGEKAVKQLQSELRLDRFLILTRVGWRIESLLWLAALRIGELHNYEIPLTSGEPADRSYGKFLELAHTLGNMQDRGDLEFVSLYKGEDGADYLAMKLNHLDEREANGVETLLGIAPERLSLPGGRFLSTIELTSVRDLIPCNREKGKCNRVPIKLKSFFEMLLDLALYVDVPADEERKRTARPFSPPTGELISRKGLHAGLIKVRSQDTQPDDAYVAVPYRGRWFSIADDDLRSKAFLMLVGSIFSLQSGDLQTVAPVLTLPVGR
jgi:hypothetical protein